MFTHFALLKNMPLEKTDMAFMLVQFEETTDEDARADDELRRRSRKK